MRAKSILTLVVVVMLIFATGCAYGAIKASEIDKRAKAARLAGKVHLDFKDADISIFIKFISELTGKNFVVSPQVRGKVTVISPTAVSIRDAYRAFLSVLEANGFAVVPTGSFYRIVPLRNVRTKGVPAYSGKYSPVKGVMFVTQVIPIYNVNVKAVYDVVRPLVSIYGNISYAAASNSLVVTDSASNIRRILSVVRKIDRMNTEMKVITLRYADADVVAQKLSKLAGKGANLPEFKVAAYGRANALLIVASKPMMKRLLLIVKRLDRKTPVRRSIFHIYHLSNADAKKVAKNLMSIVKTMGKAGKGGVPAVTVAADTGTNSIIVKATPEEYEALLPVIKYMDKSRKQVLIKALIVEVNLTKLHKEGFSWEAIGGKVWDSVMYGGKIVAGGGGAEDFSRFIGTIGNTTITEVVGATLNLVRKYGALNVLSSPQITCLDNEQASLMVGQVIPRLKNETTNISNTSTVNKSYEYEKIGLELRVTPHITSDSFVRLEINQVVEELLSPIGSPTPTTSRRSISTTVVVNNGQTVVLGGLIKNIVKKELWKAPILSEIPIIGGLFKAVNTERGKVDLIIFLTPYIIQSPGGLTKMSKPYQKKIKDLKQWNEFWKEWLKRRNEKGK